MLHIWLFFSLSYIIMLMAFRSQTTKLHFYFNAIIILNIWPFFQFYINAVLHIWTISTAAKPWHFNCFPPLILFLIIPHFPPFGLFLSPLVISLLPDPDTFVPCVKFLQKCLIFNKQRLIHVSLNHIKLLHIIFLATPSPWLSLQLCLHHYVTVLSCYLGSEIKREVVDGSLLQHYNLLNLLVPLTTFLFI